MHRLSPLIAAAVMAALAGCVAAPPVAGYRTEGAQMSSIAAFDPARFQGRWYEVAGFHAGKCAVGAMTVTRQTTGQMLVTEGPCASTPPRQYLVAPSGAGRLAPVDGSAPLWVLWVDGGYRTAVIGTPSGEFGYVLNRTRSIPADRMQAARDILDFNGYDVTQLRPSGL